MERPKWLLALLVVLAGCAVGASLNVLTRLPFPIWILPALAIVFSAEKWYHRETAAHRTIGKMYRAFMNVLFLSLVGATIWTATQVFSKNLEAGPLAGSLLLVGELLAFIWMWKVVARNRWRWPSVTLTAFAGLVLFLIVSFAGVDPFATYKDNALNSVSTSLRVIRSQSSSSSNPTSSAKVQSASLIPYGTYVNTVLGISSAITLNLDGTCSMDSALTGKVVGTYTVDSNYITTVDPISHAASRIRYRYIDQFKCLYIGEGDQPAPFYRR